MTDLVEATMPEPVQDEGSSGRHILWIVLAGFGIVMTGGAIAGYLAEHQSQGGGPLRTAGIIAMTVFAGIIVGLAYAIWRSVKALRVKALSLDAGNLTRRERLNRNIVLACALLGAAFGAVLMATGSFDVTDPEASAFSAFSNGSLPAPVAMVAVFFWGGVMPVVAWFWHTRAIDEQEERAYRDGGYYAAYAYLILAPVWWLLWRGGLLPEPNGVAIFMAFAFIWSAVWFWKKYR